jgi:hypothetical protein
MSGHSRVSILKALTSICSSVSLVKSVSLRALGLAEGSQSARPLIQIQTLTDEITNSISEQQYHELLVRLKLTVARDDTGLLMIDILEKIEDKLNANDKLSGACDYLKAISIDPSLTGTIAQTSMYIVIYYRRTK